MRVITGILVLALAIAVGAPSKPAYALASASWCLGWDNNKNTLSDTDCPIVVAQEVDDGSGTGGTNLEVWVKTQNGLTGDVTLEQFGFEWGPAITADDISDITIFGASQGTATFDGKTWELDKNLFASMDGFGQFDVVFNLVGDNANQGVSGDGDGAGSAALFFIIMGGSVSDFALTGGSNCNFLSGCLQAAKISSQQLGYAGGFVSNVPLPGAVWLFLSALAGLFGIGFSRRRAS